MPPPAALPTIPEAEEEWEYDKNVELDVDVPEAAPMDPTAPKPTSSATQISKDTILLYSTNPAMPTPDVLLCDIPNG